MSRSKGTLAVVAEMPAHVSGGRIAIHLSFGRVIDELARRHRKVLLCCPAANARPDAARDYDIQSPNVELIPQPYYRSSLAALRHPFGLFLAYRRVCSRCDAVFIRGMLPYVGMFYLLARLSGCRCCHWIVGDPIALLGSHKRSGRLKDFLSLLYARQDRLLARLGRRLTGGAFICNGQELADVYASPRTTAVVSSTITEDEFFVRDDACRGDEIRLLFVGFVRPEKGVEYLIEALPLLKLEKPWRLTIIGPWDGHAVYKSRLDGKVASLGLSGRVEWAGYVSYGPEMWQYLRTHDIFVLPTLSEGTPRVLVEARANSLPVVSTRVGGISTSVTDGHDGLLVEPKDPAAIAEAVNRITSDAELRRALIRNGLASARQLTVGRFAEKACAMLDAESRA